MRSRPDLLAHDEDLFAYHEQVLALFAAGAAVRKVTVSITASTKGLEDACRRAMEKIYRLPSA